MKEIPGYEGLYAVDKSGNVYSLITTNSRRKGLIKPYSNAGGYLRVNLYKNGICKHEYVHRLVAQTYLANPKNENYVNHKDNNPANNAPENLEWCTAKYNISYSRKQGNQYKDLSVVAFSVITGETITFQNIREAAQTLFGKWYALNYERKKCGNVIYKNGWRISINARD